MNILNSEYLKQQIEAKKSLKNNKMSEQEWAYNRQLLHKIKGNKSQSSLAEEII